MKTLPANVILEKNKLATASAWLLLLDIDITGNGSVDYRLVRNTANITYGGNVYTAFPFELDVIGRSADGKIPRISLRVSNVNLTLSSYLEANDGMAGGTIKLTIVNSENLTEDYTELEMDFEIISSAANNLWITFVLGVPSPLRHAFPIYSYTADSCNWEYASAECGHTGGACNRTFNNCSDNGNTARYGGHIGLRSGITRII